MHFKSLSKETSSMSGDYAEIDRLIIMIYLPIVLNQFHGTAVSILIGLGTCLAKNARTIFQL